MSFRFAIFWLIGLIPISRKIYISFSDAKSSQQSISRASPVLWSSERRFTAGPSTTFDHAISNVKIPPPPGFNPPIPPPPISNRPLPPIPQTNSVAPNAKTTNHEKLLDSAIITSPSSFEPSVPNVDFSKIRNISDSYPESGSIIPSIPAIPLLPSVQSVISVLNPTPVTSKPKPNYIISPSPTKSILRRNNNNNIAAIDNNAVVTSKSSSNNRVVSFDLAGNLNFGGKLAPKSSNPSMPNLSKLTRNPFLDYIECSDDDDDYSNVEISNNNNLEKRSESTERLGTSFFVSLITNTNFPDPWSNNPSSGGLPAKSDSKSNSVAHPASTFKSG